MAQRRQSMAMCVLLRRGDRAGDPRSIDDAAVRLRRLARARSSNNNHAQK
jgi:hypothetical protein